MVAAKCEGEDDYSVLVTGGEPMVTGRHYWEVKLTGGEDSCVCVGAVCPGLDHGSFYYDGGYPNSDYHDDAVPEQQVYYIENGELNGAVSEENRLGHNRDYRQQVGGFKSAEPDDCIGCLLDLDAGWLRFYRNGNRCGPGFVSGVTGPLVRAVEIFDAGAVVTALPGALAPAGAGDADEPPGNGWAKGKQDTHAAAGAGAGGDGEWARD